MWTNICIEGFCFAETEGDTYPCGNKCTSHLCLENGHCPHFAYSPTTERNVACFPPLHLILRDRLSIYWMELGYGIEWFFWGQLWFNRRKSDEFFKNIEVATAEDDPIIAEWEKERKTANKKFSKWFNKVSKGKNPRLDGEDDALGRRM